MILSPWRLAGLRLLRDGIAWVIVALGWTHLGLATNMGWWRVMLFMEVLLATVMFLKKIDVDIENLFDGFNGGGCGGSCGGT